MSGHLAKYKIGHEIKYLIKNFIKMSNSFNMLDKNYTRSHICKFNIDGMPFGYGQ